MENLHLTVMEKQYIHVHVPDNKFYMENPSIASIVGSWIKTVTTLKKRVTLRTSAFASEVFSYLDHQVQKGKKPTEAICDLLKKGLDAHEQEKAAFESLHQKEGASIDTNQYVQHGDPVLIPCPTTGRWMTKRQCEGCHLKCNVPTNLRTLFEGLALHTKT